VLGFGLRTGDQLVESDRQRGASKGRSDARAVDGREGGMAGRQDVEIFGGGGPQNSGAACVESGVEMTQGVPHKANRQ
jgi:hypothetical protein